MQKKTKPVIACVGLLAGSLVALSGTMAQATSAPGPAAAGRSAAGAPAAVAADALYVAPDGAADAAGTEADPTTLAAAIGRVTSGGTIYLRGGTYAYAETVTIPPGNDGSANARTTLAAYPGERPVLNFSAMSEDPANRGLAVNGAYWHVDGIVVEHAGDNGIFVGGSHNVVEHVVTRFNHDSGLQISRIASDTPDDEWPSDNLILSSSRTTTPTPTARTPTASRRSSPPAPATSSATRSPTTTSTTAGTSTPRRTRAPSAR